MTKLRKTTWRRIAACAAVGCQMLAGVTLAHAATVFDGDGNTNWWFDPVNWSRQDGPFLPPAKDDGSGNAIRDDTQINNGTGAWDVTGEGVVYDPDNDPFYADAFNLQYPTGSANASAPYNAEYGPESIYRLYISRNSANQNLLTIKSGNLYIDSTTIVGRSGSTTEQQNEGRINQLGGALRVPYTSIDIGLIEDSGWGNGVYDYRGGILEVSMENGGGIRLAHGSTTLGPSGV
ncbi:MAG: hypothetical protein KDA61_12000, partial [Planctomycetales bacterium]|nr:hypothetical protein [Planctomycetales bacterium]